MDFIGFGEAIWQGKSSKMEAKIVSKRHQQIMAKRMLVGAPCKGNPPSKCSLGAPLGPWSGRGPGGPSYRLPLDYDFGWILVWFWNQFGTPGDPKGGIGCLL